MTKGHVGQATRLSRTPTPPAPSPKPPVVHGSAESSQPEPGEFVVLPGRLARPDAVPETATNYRPLPPEPATHGGGRRDRWPGQIRARCR